MRVHANAPLGPKGRRTMVVRVLEVISGHHSAAIQMALIEVRGGRYPQATRLAREIVRTQSRELRRFNALLGQTEG